MPGNAKSQKAGATAKARREEVREKGRMSREKARGKRAPWGGAGIAKEHTMPVTALTW